MENNECNVKNLDGDVLLPPRKRLLAGMKRQNSDVYSQTLSTSSCGGDDFDTRTNNLLNNHLVGNPNLSMIVESSRLAYVEAVEVARAAKIVADEKAAIAAKAMAAAMSALELVATISDEDPDEELTSEGGRHHEKYLKNYKMKKHVAIQSLYSKQKDPQSCTADEEIARKLHQVINSSPRISKNGSTSESKHHSKLKKVRIPAYEKTNGSPDFEIGRTSTGNGVSAYHMDSTSNAVQGKYRTSVDLNSSKFKKQNGLKLEDRERHKIIHDPHHQVNRENGNAGLAPPENRYGEGDDDGIVRKRMKLKQKMLPLSICNVRDLESPKESLKSKNMPSARDTSFEATTPSSKPLFPVGPSSDTVGIDGERASLWKCQTFKSPTSVKQNQVMQS